MDLTARTVLTPCVVETELELICLERGGGHEVMKIRVSGSRPPHLRETTMKGTREE